MTVINTNVRSLVAAQAIQVNDRAMSKAMQSLSTGKRINSAGDDAAGLAISDKMTAQIRGLNQAVRNANDGISMLQTVEGATQAISDMLQRMRELSVQASNGTYDETTDLAALDNEFQNLAAQLVTIGAQTTWNGFSVADGSKTSVDFQVNADGKAPLTATLKDLTSGKFDFTGVDIATNGTAKLATASVDDAIVEIDAYRASLGGKINQLAYAADNLASIATNTAASRSRILDTDYAQATTELARTQIIQQAATAMLVQANQSNTTVLTLLKG